MAVTVLTYLWLMLQTTRQMHTYNLTYVVLLINKRNLVQILYKRNNKNLASWLHDF